MSARTGNDYVAVAVNVAMLIIQGTGSVAQQTGICIFGVQSGRCGVMVSTTDFESVDLGSIPSIDHSL